MESWGAGRLKEEMWLQTQQVGEQPCSTPGGAESCWGPAAAPTIILTEFYSQSIRKYMTTANGALSQICPVNGEVGRVHAERILPLPAAVVGAGAEWVMLFVSKKADCRDPEIAVAWCHRVFVTALHQRAMLLSGAGTYHSDTAPRWHGAASTLCELPRDRGCLGLPPLMLWHLCSLSRLIALLRCSCMHVI